MVVAAHDFKRHTNSTKHISSLCLLYTESVHATPIRDWQDWMHTSLYCINWINIASNAHIACSDHTEEVLPLDITHYFELWLKKRSCLYISGLEYKQLLLVSQCCHTIKIPKTNCHATNNNNNLLLMMLTCNWQLHIYKPASLNTRVSSNLFISWHDDNITHLWHPCSGCHISRIPLQCILN